MASIIDFYDLHNSDFNNLSKKINTYLGRMPKSIVPIADCPGGDQLCIGVDKEVWAKIYFWDHNEETFDSSKDELWNNVYLVANSFVEFILSFQTIEEKNAPKVNVTTTPEFLAMARMVEKLKNKKKSSIKENFI